MLLNFRDNIETDHQQQAVDLGLSPTELAFYNIFVSELGGKDALGDSTESQVKEVVQSLVKMLDEATQIVDFFSKWDERKRVKRDIKRKVIENFDESLVAPITERFMDLAETKFK
jgi:type I restriction enzyme R subunit